MRAGANLPAVGGYNQAVILDAIRRAPDGISRVEVAERTGLSAQTVSNVCRRLIDLGLVREAGTQASGVGKPRTMLQLEPRGSFALGVHLDPSVITVVLLDLAGTVIEHRTIPTPTPSRAVETIGRIAQVAGDVTNAAGIPARRLLGAGIAAPGPVDVDNGMVLNPPLLAGWRNVPVRDELAAALGVPVLLEKDVTAAAVAELWMHTDAERGNMVFFYYGTGVGVGLVVQNEVLRGVSSNAGDIGSLIVAGGDRTQSGGGRHRLGDAIMPRFLVEDALERGVFEAQAHSPAAHSGVLGTERVRELFVALAAAAVSGDPVAAELIDGTAAAIATSLTETINLLDVNHVIFGGPFFTPVADYLLARVPGLVRADPTLVSPHPISFAASEIGEDVAAVGAACLVLDHALSPRPAGLLITRA